jgi:hypothetical protein
MRTFTDCRAEPILVECSPRRIGVRRERRQSFFDHASSVIVLGRNIPLVRKLEAEASLVMA